MKYLLVIDGFGRFSDFSKYARVFRSTTTAKAYVSELHEQAWDQEKYCFKEGEEWDGALLYKVNKDGSLTLVEEYDTSADANGVAIGWEIANEKHCYFR